MIALLTSTLVAGALLSAPVDATTVVAKHNGDGIEVRWFPPAPQSRTERWAYRVDRIDSEGTTLSITHMPLQSTLNVATIRDRLGSFSESFIGAIAYGSEAKRINESSLNEALTNPLSRALIVRFAVLYPSVADLLGWRRLDRDLQPGKTYTYRVIAIDRSKQDAESVLGQARAIAQVSGVSAPRDVSVTQSAPDRLEVRWTRDTLKEANEAVLRYIVYRRERTGPWVAMNPGLTPTVGVSASRTARYVDTSVLAARTYQYAVAAVDLVGRVSTKSSTSSIQVADQRAPLPPLDLKVTRGERDLSVTWLAAGLAPDIKDVEILKVRRTRVEGGPREVLKVLGRVGAKTGIYRTRAPGLGQHEYALRSVDQAGNRGPLSVSVSLHVDRALRLKTPTGVKAKLTQRGEVEVSWRATPGTDAVTYVVERRAAGQSGPVTRVNPLGLTIRDKRYVDQSPPVDGPPLSYRVRAVTPGSASSAASPWVSLKDMRRAPRAHVTLATGSDQGVRLAWRARKSALSAGFVIQVQVDGASWRSLTKTPLAPEARSYVDRQVKAPEALIRYRVQSLGGAPGDPILSNVVTYRVAAAPLSAPTQLSARCLPRGVELRWKTSKAATSYEVQRAFGAEGFSPRVQTMTGQWRDTTLLKARRYRYRVLARHGVEISGPSEPIEVICSER